MTTKNTMSGGPFFDKAWQRREYHEQLKDRAYKMRGGNFAIPEKGPSRPAYEPRRSPGTTIDADGCYIPLEYSKAEAQARARQRKADRDALKDGSVVNPVKYTKEEKKAIKSRKAMDDARPTSWKTSTHHSGGNKQGLDW